LRRIVCFFCSCYDVSYLTLSCLSAR